MLLRRHEDLAGEAHVEAAALGAARSIVADMKFPERAVETRSGRKDLLLIEALAPGARGGPCARCGGGASGRRCGRCATCACVRRP